MVAGSDLVKRLTILIDAQDVASRKFENLRHKINQSTMALQNMSKVDKKSVVGQNLQQQVVQQKAVAEGQRHNIALRKMDIQTTKRLTDQAFRFRMEYLGILFAGMAIQRVTGQFLRSAITSYNEAFEETSAFEKITNRLKSSWKFFQFQLVDALTQSELFKSFINTIASLIDVFANLDKEIRTGIIATVAAAFMVGGALATLAAAILAWSSIKMAFAAGSGPSTLVGKINTSGLGKLIGAGFIIKGIMDLEGADTVEERLNSITDILLGMGIFKGNVWIISIAVVIKFREELETAVVGIGKFLTEVSEKGFERAEEDIGKGDFFSGFLDTAIGTISASLDLLFFPIEAGVRILNGTVTELINLLEGTEENVQVVSDKVNETAVPAFEELAETADESTFSVLQTKEAIDSIPDETVKTLRIVTIRESRGGRSALDRADQPL